MATRAGAQPCPAHPGPAESSDNSRRIRLRSWSADRKAHVQAVNQLLSEMRPASRRAREIWQSSATAARRNPTHAHLTTLVTHKHEAHDWVRGIEKIWDFYFESLVQRQSRFGLWLRSTDRIARNYLTSLPISVSARKNQCLLRRLLRTLRTGFGPANAPARYQAASARSPIQSLSAIPAPLPPYGQPVDARGCASRK